MVGGTVDEHLAAVVAIGLDQDRVPREQEQVAHVAAAIYDRQDVTGSDIRAADFGY
jgi:hypothetical protein